MAARLITAEDLLGDDPAAVMRDLLQRAKLDVLFEAQQIGSREPSGATAGTMLYAAGYLPGISDEEMRPYLAELESLLDDSGILQTPVKYRTTVETNWTDAWCLAAMLRRPHLVNRATLEHFGSSFVDRQELSGGWGLRPDRLGRPHPLFAIPASLVLRDLRRHGYLKGYRVNAATANLTRYLRRPEPEPLPVRLLRAVALRNVGTALDPRVVEELHEQTWRNGEVEIHPVTVTREDQPLWYAAVDRALMFLATRRLWPALDPVNARLATEIIDTYNADRGGWSNHPSDAAICTWRTAESLLAVHLLARDLARLEVSFDTWQARRESSKILRETDGFDVGISYSSKQRDIAAKIRHTLREAGLTVFYDEDYRHEQLGADLNVYLHDTYFRRCRYAIAILSEDFVRSDWSGSLEWRAILTRLQEARGNFLLPYFIDDVVVPGLSPSIGYISSQTHTPEEFAVVVLRKIMSSRRS